MELRVTRDVMEMLRDEAIRACPHECCGILLGKGLQIEAVRPARNVHACPQTHFEIDPQTLINAHRDARLGGREVIGYYHSHPDGPAGPSATDLAMAAGDGAIWAIVTPSGEAGFWRDTTEGFIALPYLADKP